MARQRIIELREWEHKERLNQPDKLFYIVNISTKDVVGIAVSHHRACVQRQFVINGGGDPELLVVMTYPEYDTLCNKEK